MQKEIKLTWILIGSLITSIGMSFIWPLTSVYLHDKLGISLTVIGVVLFFNSIASVIGSLLGGTFFDRYNPYHLILGGSLFMVAVLSLLIFFHGWPVFAFALFFTGIGSGWNSTIVAAMGASVKKYDGRYVFNMLYFAQNLGNVLGTALVGFIYAKSVALLFILAASLYAIFLVIAGTTYRPIENFHRQAKQAATMEKLKIKLPKNNLLLLNSFFGVLFFAWVMYQQWVSNLSVYMTGLGIPLSHYSLLWTLNAALIVIVQLVLVKISRYVKNVMHQIYFGLAMLGVSFLILLLAKVYPIFVVAMVVLTLGEATALPAIPALINELTPQAIKGRYLGLANSFAAAGRAIGPLFGGLIIEGASYHTLFVIAGVTNFILLSAILLIYQRARHTLKKY